MIIYSHLAWVCAHIREIELLALVLFVFFSSLDVLKGGVFI